MPAGERKKRRSIQLSEGPEIGYASSMGGCAVRVRRADGASAGRGRTDPQGQPGPAWRLQAHEIRSAHGGTSRADGFVHALMSNVPAVMVAFLIVTGCSSSSGSHDAGTGSDAGATCADAAANPELAALHQAEQALPAHDPATSLDVTKPD